MTNKRKEQQTHWTKRLKSYRIILETATCRHVENYDKQWTNTWRCPRSIDCTSDEVACFWQQPTRLRN